ncbi:MAG TPA: SRPBCC domain-containing protein [Streptosporangiaceae bacterium]|nr:SRPBCC domain-containing protein [Streptosporangiaceae bacterium]
MGEPVCCERLVQSGDLLPVAGLLQVQVGDGRLEQVGPGAPSCHGPLQQHPALVDLPRVPQGTVLVVEGDDLPIAQAGRFPGVVQQHQRQQREYFGFVRHEFGQCPAEVDSFRGEVDAVATGVYFGDAEQPAAVMQVLTDNPDHVVWRVTDGPDAWVGTQITFTLRPSHDGTTLLFTHAGWQQASEFMSGCSTNWGAYLTSLKTGAESDEFAAYPAGEISRWD